MRPVCFNQFLIALLPPELMEIISFNLYLYFIVNGNPQLSSLNIMADDVSIGELQYVTFLEYLLQINPLTLCD